MSSYIIAYTFLSVFPQGSELSPLEMSGIVPYAEMKYVVRVININPALKVMAVREKTVDDIY
jgi:hypothetical protein